MKKVMVLKVGTEVVFGHAELEPRDVMLMIARSVKKVRREGWQVVIVTSGAIGAARNIMGFSQLETSVAEDQWLASLGQPELIQQWREAFAAHGLRVGQILITHRDHGFLKCLEQHGKMGTIAIVNENDPESSEEIRSKRRGFSDNDDLAFRLARRIKAEAVLFLTKSGGIFNRLKSGRVEYLEVAHTATQRSLGIDNTVGSRSKGGMVSKFKFAKKAYRAGVRLVSIAALEENIAWKFLQGEAVGTRIGKRTQTR